MRTKHYARIVVVIIAALSSTAINGQTLKPSYLSEMPNPARILSEIQGKDAEDTIERQMGAFQALIKMIDDMAWGLEKRYLPNKATQDEAQLRLAYGQAYADLWHKATRKEEHLYDHDRPLLGELLTKLFSPGFRDLYSKSDANAEEYYRAYRAKMSGPLVTIGPQPTPGSKPPANPLSGPAATQRPTTPAKPATVVGPSDPGIVKARAANVDTKVFGIPLGEPLTLPKCTGGILGPPTSTNCIEEHEFANAVVSAAFGVDADPKDGRVVEVQLPQNNCPTWMECSFYATIQNGRFVAARLRTKGRDVEAAAGKELRGKYGQRASMQQRFITPNNGGSKFEVFDLDWQFPGLHVEYKVVDATILDGQVLIESETVYDVRKAGEREAARPKL